MVWGVPPDGEFEPRTDYRDAAYSSYYQNVCYLEPILMGISTEIGNKADRGATWVRTVLEFQPSGIDLVVLVGESSNRICPDQDHGSAMAAICEAIFEDVRRAFSLELEDAKGETRIGFITAVSKNT